jgi:VIT1/CCC1 family predicted Fe2+/Mn2+ transporter
MSNFIKRYLDPAERMSELLFGLIMTLTFTLGASLVIKEGPDATREMLIGVLGCNIAWGIIDGLLYVFNSMFARGAANRVAHLYKKEGRDGVGTAVDDFLSETIGGALSTPTREQIRQEVTDYVAQTKPAPVQLTREDIYGAIASFILVALTSAPAVLPFFFLDDRLTALRVSNFIMIGLIYMIGYQWAAHIDASRQKIGLSMAFGALIIVQVTIFLGG